MIRFQLTVLVVVAFFVSVILSGIMSKINFIVLVADVIIIYYLNSLITDAITEHYIKVFMLFDLKSIGDDLKSKLDLFHNGIFANKCTLSKRLKELDTYAKFTDLVDELPSSLDNLYCFSPYLSFNSLTDLVFLMTRMTQDAQFLLDNFITEDDESRAINNLTQYVDILGSYINLVDEYNKVYREE